MKTKSKIITVLITIIIGVVVLLSNLTNQLYANVNTYYQVYLNGNEIGIIDDEEELYQLIDDNQSAIKEKYQVSNVYPPTDLKVIEKNTYIGNVDDVLDVYNKIQEEDDFAVKGYVVTVKGEDKSFNINVLDKDVFYNATKKFVSTFLDEYEYENYINSAQDEIVDTGHIIENMEFSEDITIKEAYISVNETIYTEESSLIQYLLFGENPDTKSYTVQLGDTIESISEDNKLNVEEFLIANTNYKSKDVILRVGDKVNVTLIDPQLTFVYDIYEISDEIVYYEKKTVTDSTKASTYSEVTTAGQNGITRNTEKYTVTNGERSQEVEIVSTEIIKEVIDQVTTKGTKYSGSYVAPDPVALDGDWGWPTNRNYTITSYYTYRWGTHHDGIDISGTGFNSPIYAVADGTVVYVYNGCPAQGSGLKDTCGGALGNYVIISHGDNIYTLYAHNASNQVSIGQTVTRGQQIAKMGSSGRATGTHLHFAVSIGYPYKGSYTFKDPMELYQ